MVVVVLFFRRSMSVRQLVMSFADGTVTDSVGERISRKIFGLVGSGLKTTISLMSGKPAGLAAVVVGYQTTRVVGRVCEPNGSVTMMQPGKNSLAVAF